MKLRSISPPLPPARTVDDALPQKKGFSKEIKKPTDSKMKGLLHGIRFHGSKAGLLPSAMAPSIVGGILSSFAGPALEEEIDLIKPPRIAKRSRLQRSHGKSIPIGLKRVEPVSWVNLINALMQWLIYLPNFTDLLYFAPRSFHCFLDFIDQYLLDQHENRPVSSANGATLYRSLLKKLPSSVFQQGKMPDLYELFLYFMKSLFPHGTASHNPSLDSVVLHPKWHIHWESNGKQTMEEAVNKKSDERPQELLISVKGTEKNCCRLIQKQFFTSQDRICYDLHAFIEQRPEGAEESSFISYLKVDGVWYQCSDDRITAHRSHSLNIPLSRSVLLYYKKVDFKLFSRF